MALVFLLALHAVLTLAGFFYLWRRITMQKAEIAELRALLGARTPTRMAVGDIIAMPAHVSARAASPLERAAQAWGVARGTRRAEYRAPTISPETGRGLTLALMAISPAAGFFFGGEAASIVAAGLAIAAAMMLVALRPVWRTAAWGAVLTATSWAAVGFGLNTVAVDPASYAFCLVLAACAGLAHAFFRRAAPGVAMALSMSAFALALASQTTMIDAAGAAYGLIVAAAAIVGAMTLRLEAVHLGAFAAAVIGLFVLSGQEMAAIWFTPIAAWTGALFFAIAVVRVPRLGSRGVALAGTGAFAPLGVMAALHSAEHGLSSNVAAAGAFLAFAVLLCGLVALAASRRRTGYAGLRVTMWVLALGAFCAFAAAIGLAMPRAFAAASFAAFAVALAGLNLRFDARVWRTFAVAAIMLSGLFAFVTAELLLAEAAGVQNWLAILAGIAAPAAFAGAAALLFDRGKAQTNAALFEFAAVVLGLAAAHLMTRLVFSGGATMLNPIGFVEAGVHSSIWLAAALLLGLRAGRGAKALRAVMSKVLAYLALFAAAASALLWLSAFWSGRRPPTLELRETLGFALPGLLLIAHWAFWRWRGQELTARASLSLGALLLAAFAAVEAMQAEGLPEWAPSLIGATSFAMAVGLNFVPNIASRPPMKAREKAPVRSRGKAPSRAARPRAR